MRTIQMKRWLAVFLILGPVAGGIDRVAAEWYVFGADEPAVGFHGFGSQGFIDSSSYDLVRVWLAKSCRLYPGSTRRLGYP